MTHGPGESYTKIGKFPTFNKEVRIFLVVFIRKLPKASFFSRFNPKIYLYHSIILLGSKFYFGMFAKLCIVSQILFFFGFILKKKIGVMLMRG